MATSSCAACGSSNTHELRQERQILQNGVTLTILDDVCTECLHCGERFYDGIQAQIADAKLASYDEAPWRNALRFAVFVHV